MRSLLAAAGLAPARDAESVWGNAARPLPLVGLLDRVADRSRYVTATVMDDRGRLADRTALKSLGWQPRQPISISTLPSAGILVVRRGGQDSVTPHGHLRLPADIRHGCRLAAGDRLLVIAHPDHDLLVAYNVFAVSAMLTAYHAIVERQDAP